MLRQILLSLVRWLNPRAASAVPNSSQCLALLQQGNLEDATACLRQCTLSYPKDTATLMMLGRTLAEQNSLIEARTTLEKAHALSPNDPDIHIYLGNVSFLQEDYLEAKRYFELALTLSPNHSTAHLGVAQALVKLDGDSAKSLKHFLAVLDQYPAQLEALQPTVKMLADYEQYDRALELLEAARAINPNSVEIENGYGFILQKMDRLDEAVAVYSQALALDGSNPSVYDNLGTAMHDLGKYDGALEAFSQALELSPQNPIPRWHRAQTLLIQYDFEHGWDEYELRLLDRHASAPMIPLPKWEGEALTGKSILVYSEQGLGDEIMFASCLPDLMKQGASCVISCSHKLKKLFTQSFPDIKVIPPAHDLAIDLPQQYPPMDFQIPIGSLARRFRQKISDFPPHSGYLKSDPERTRFWQERLQQYGPGLKVGVSWTGGTRLSHRQRRSLKLHQLLPILKVPHVTFVSLQYTPCQDDIANMLEIEGIHIHHWQEAIDDYAETAALVSALDIVISVCTSIIHLSGSLSKPVWVLVPRNPEWRYGAEGVQMPWYPSARLFRQENIGEWDNTIQRVAHELQAAQGSEYGKHKQ